MVYLRRAPKRNAGISGATFADPYLVKIEPGTYDIGSTPLTMRPFVDLEGSGQHSTSITASVSSLGGQGAIIGAGGSPGSLPLGDGFDPGRDPGKRRPSTTTLTTASASTTCPRRLRAVRTTPLCSSTTRPPRSRTASFRNGVSGSCNEGYYDTGLLMDGDSTRVFSRTPLLRPGGGKRMVRFGAGGSGCSTPAKAGWTRCPGGGGGGHSGGGPSLPSGAFRGGGSPSPPASVFWPSAPCREPTPRRRPSPGSRGLHARESLLVHVERVVAGGEVAVAVVHERRLDLGADLRRVAAARVEAAAGGRVDRARHVALEHDPLALLGEVGVGHGHGREQRLGVGHDRPRVELLRRRELDELAEVHDRDPVGDVADDAEVVRDEDVGEVELVLELLEQVDHLRLDRDVEGGDRLVGHDQLRAQRERARDPDPLPLPARELVREAVVVLRREADLLEQLLDGLLALLAVADPVDAHRVADDRADALARVQARVGVLEDHLHLAAKRPQRAGAQLADRAAVEDHVPSVGSSRRTMQRPRVDLPQPDSPTRPRVSPSATLTVTSSTACTRATSRERTPFRIGKYFLRC